MSYRYPHEKIFKAGGEYLEPRNSFQRWVEIIEGTSRDWTDDQRKFSSQQLRWLLTGTVVDTASMLGMLYAQYGRFKLTETEDAHVQAIDETFNLNLTGKLNLNIYNIVNFS